MKFSFLMCVHEDQPFLDQSLLSMISQDYDDEYEIIVVANNCSDELFKKLEKYARGSEKIKLFRTAIGQLTYNLNFGSEQARGEYLVRMDADDVCFPDRLSRTLEMLDRHDNPDVLSGLSELICEDNLVFDFVGKVRNEKNIKRVLPFINPIVHPATAIKRVSLIKVRGYWGGINCEDYDLWLRMDRASMRLVIADFFAIKYRINFYQVKGSRIGHADRVALVLREALFRGSFIYFVGAFFSLAKFFLILVMNRMK